MKKDEKVLAFPIPMDYIPQLATPQKKVAEATQLVLSLHNSHNERDAYEPHNYILRLVGMNETPRFHTRTIRASILFAYPLYDSSPLSRYES